MTVQYLSKVFSSIHTLFLLTLFVILRYEEKSFQMKTNHRFFFVKWNDVVNISVISSIKFKRQPSNLDNLWKFLWKYWLLNSHNSKLIAGGSFLRVKTLVSQCANWFDIWWSKKLNREPPPVSSFFKDFCNLLEGDN